jgi:hypothetical protein
MSAERCSRKGFFRNRYETANCAGVDGTSAKGPGFLEKLLN